MTSYTSTVYQDESSNPPFEGPEKLLEIWFAPSEEFLEKAGNPEGLRVVKKETWEKKVLDLVRCKVMSVIEGEDLDAYLLSESSMFIWPHKMILKTCGTTTLLLGMDNLLEIAREECGLTETYRCFYSRKAFMFPERQVGPHRHWDEEVKVLDSYFGKGNGSAYVVGKMNGDHWLLYLTTPKEMYPEAATNGELDHLMQEVLSFDTKGSAQQPSSSSSNAISTVSKLPKAPSPPDQTLEILMTHLDPEACKQFYYPPPSAEQVALSQSPGSNGEVPQKGHHEGRILSERLGIDKLLPGASLDSFLFEPCGYSANMVRGDRYATIHVTPENDFSYASFECNVDFRAGQAVSSSTSSSQYPSTVLHDLVARVLSIFQPSKFSISLFVSVEESAAGVDQGQSPETRMILSPNVADGYKRTDRILYEYAGYHLLFSTFEKQ